MYRRCTGDEHLRGETVVNDESTDQRGREKEERSARTRRSP
jgi:hypothetical protein